MTEFEIPYTIDFFIDQFGYVVHLINQKADLGLDVLISSSSLASWVV